MAFLGSGVRRGQRGDTAMVGSDGRFSVVGRWQWAQRERGEVSAPPARGTAPDGGTRYETDFLRSHPRGVNDVGVLTPPVYPLLPWGCSWSCGAVGGAGCGLQPNGMDGRGWGDVAVGNGPSSHLLSWSCRPIAALSRRWAAGVKWGPPPLSVTVKMGSEPPGCALC